jgi:hypothetical protein
MPISPVTPESKKSSTGLLETTHIEYVAERRKCGCQGLTGTLGRIGPQVSPSRALTNDSWGCDRRISQGRTPSVSRGGISQSLL